MRGTAPPSSVPTPPLGAEVLWRVHQADPQRYPVLLESADGPAGGVFDLLLAFPGDTLRLDDTGQSAFADPPRPAAGPFLAALDAWWQALRIAPGTTSLPFRGGWFLYLGYELAGQIEPSLKLPGAERGGGPRTVACAVRVPAALVRDRATGQGWIVTESEYAELRSRIAADLAAVLDAPPPQAPAGEVSAHLEEEDPERFLAAVRTALAHIAAGDVYQANLSRRWHGHLTGRTTPAAVYRRLRQANPGPFTGLALLDDRAIVSSSPERLLRIAGGEVSTRPIAGTRPRSADPAVDQALAGELRGHPKELAEHVMLIDLERNDLGRICVGGSVQVDEYLTLESYAHVHHIVSNVSGRLRDGVTPGQAIAAVFPGGTITGCPKVRCMQLIAELEGTGRGAYTGSMGYLNRDGSLDLNILIRTLTMRGTELEFRAGAGIVADSDPVRELEETRAKALGLCRALGA